MNNLLHYCKKEKQKNTKAKQNKIEKRMYCQMQETFVCIYIKRKTNILLCAISGRTLYQQIYFLRKESLISVKPVMDLQGCVMHIILGAKPSDTQYEPLIIFPLIQL